MLSRAAKKYEVWFGLGLLEREGDQLFDSALLFDPAGEIVLKYRRNQPKWHGRHADPKVYRQGTAIPTANTPLGTVVFLICGDLSDEAIVARVRALTPALLLFPFARRFSGGGIDQERWDREEAPEYARREGVTGALTLMVNYLGSDALGDASFGGAMIVSPQEEVRQRLPLGQKGRLIAGI